MESCLAERRNCGTHLHFCGSLLLVATTVVCVLIGLVSATTQIFTASSSQMGKLEVAVQCSDTRISIKGVKLTGLFGDLRITSSACPSGELQPGLVIEIINCDLEGYFDFGHSPFRASPERMIFNGAQVNIQDNTFRRGFRGIYAYNGGTADITFTNSSTFSITGNHVQGWLMVVNADISFSANAPAINLTFSDNSQLIVSQNRASYMDLVSSVKSGSFNAVSFSESQLIVSGNTVANALNVILAESGASVVGIFENRSLVSIRDNKSPSLFSIHTRTGSSTLVDFISNSQFIVSANSVESMDCILSDGEGSNTTVVFSSNSILTVGNTRAYEYRSRMSVVSAGVSAGDSPSFTALSFFSHSQLIIRENAVRTFANPFKSVLALGYTFTGGRVEINFNGPGRLSLERNTAVMYYYCPHLACTVNSTEGNFELCQQPDTVTWNAPGSDRPTGFSDCTIPKSTKNNHSAAVVVGVVVMMVVIIAVACVVWFRRRRHTPQVLENEHVNSEENGEDLKVFSSVDTGGNTDKFEVVINSGNDVLCQSQAPEGKGDFDETRSVGDG